MHVSIGIMRPAARGLLIPVMVSLVILGALIERPAPAVGAGIWVQAAAMNGARAHHVAALLPNGNVLVAGGEAQKGGAVSFLDTAEIYKPGAASWTQVASMSTPRADFTATRLQDGRILVAGGINDSGYLSSAEIFDPAANGWTGAGNMLDARSGHTATLLKDGTVLVAGGFNGSGSLASAEVYTPSSNSWAAVGSMSQPRGEHTAAILPDGTVLVAGGLSSSGPTAAADIFDPAKGTFSPTGSMTSVRYLHTATTLSNGTVLVAGGSDLNGSLPTAEIYNPAAGLWSAAGSMHTARDEHTATLLPNGQVLVTGGRSVSAGTTTYLASTEAFDPGTESWSETGSMSTPRASHTATLLADGSALAAGGFGGSGYLNSADHYVSQQAATPTATAAPATTVTPSTPIATVVTVPPTDTPIPVASPSPTPAEASPIPSGTPPTPTVAPATPTSTPLAFDFEIVSVRVEKRTTKPDWNLVQPPLRTVQVGTPVTLSAYINVATIPDGSRFTLSLEATLGKSIIRQSGFTGILSQKDVGDLWEHTNITPRTPGKYAFTVTMTINGQSKRGNAAFTVVQQVVRPRPVALHFVRLTTVDQAGRATATFTAGKRAWLLATWNVQNAPSGARIAITDTLQYPVGASWRPLGPPLQNVFDAINGIHSYRFSFVPQGPYTSLRIVVGITVGSRTVQRAATIQLRH